MIWQDYITKDSALLNGKPIIKETCISIEFILENYPSLSKESLKAVYAYVYDSMKDNLLIHIPQEAT